MTRTYAALWLAGALVCVVGIHLSLADGTEVLAAAFVVLLAALVWELVRGGEA